MVDYGRDKQIKMNILIELAHPRHYHQFKAVRDIMTQRGNKVILAATDRKLLIELLQESSEEFVLFKHTTSGSINDVYDALMSSNLHIVGEEVFSVNHCLVGIDEVPLAVSKKSLLIIRLQDNVVNF